MLYPELKLAAHRRALGAASPFSDCVEFYVYAKHGDRIDEAEPIVLHEASEEDMLAVPEATFKLSLDSAQELIDSLWACGLRPTEGSGSAGAMAATERHLQDMRKLVFEKNGPER